MCRAAGSSNGRTPLSESGNFGSSPSPAALHEIDNKASESGNFGSSWTRREVRGTSPEFPIRKLSPSLPALRGTDNRRL